MLNDLSVSCPCQSKRAYSQCCRILHEGQPAVTPEALMRSRYSAFALDLTDYLSHSWHSTTRPTFIEPQRQTQWKSLQILGSGETGELGWVHFRATFKENADWAFLEERSNFRKEEGQWRYVDGTPTIQPIKTERNGLCPCGSGRKFKKCCMT